MLIRDAVLKAILAGEVQCAFRRWRRPTVKTGGTLKTPIGVLRIDTVAKVPLVSITALDTRKAGYPNRDVLIAELMKRDQGSVYRIDFHLEGPDPRIALRENAQLSAAEIKELGRKLARFDASSPHGPWTIRVLDSIRAHPRQRAGQLALELGVPKEWLKVGVRKLKDLGLTISHEPGYELSPRGSRLLHELQRP